MQDWRQGDVALGDAGLFVSVARLDAPISVESKRVAANRVANGEAVSSEVEAIAVNVVGVIVITQTCDIVLPSADRPYICVAPLESDVAAEDYANIAAGRRPSYYAVPTLKDRRIVADLNRTMTVEKSIASQWQRVDGTSSDDQIRAFGRSLSRHTSRFAFPDDFADFARKMMERLKKKHGKATSEGRHLEMMREIRVRARPDWDATRADIDWFFIVDDDLSRPDDAFVADWSGQIASWLALLDQGSRFVLGSALPYRLEDMTAREWVESDQLDLDHLSSR